MVTTMRSAFGGLRAENSETQKVIEQMMWVKSKEQIVIEFFWLRKEVIYDNEWVNVVDMINEFKDTAALKRCRVKYHEKLAEFGISESEFKAMFPNGLPTLETKKIDNGEQKSNTRKPRTTKAK